jgi:nucleoside-diphosphate-sugar epimerase
MRVFVAGATGAIGRRLVPQLISRGHRVVGTTARRDRLEAVSRLGAEPLVMDGLDAGAVRDAVTRAKPDAIVHQMTGLSGNPDIKHFDRWFAQTNHLRTRGTRQLLDAATLAGVEQVIVQSFTGWTNSRTGAAVKTEDDPLDPEPATAQAQSLAAIRFLERAVLDASLDAAAALRYGVLYGPGASEMLVAGVRKRRWPIVGDGGGVWSWIHVDDAAAATVAALERGSRGIYNVVDDDPAEVAQWLPHLAQVLGAKPPRRVPTWVGKLVVGDVGVRWMTEARGASNQNAKRELGWRPRYRSWRDGFEHGLDVDLPEPAELDYSLRVSAGALGGRAG